MRPTIVWIDTQHAKIFDIEGPHIELHALHRHEYDSGYAVDSAPGSAHFYRQVAGRLEEVSELLILGPGVAKDQFHHHLLQHHHADLARRVVGVETTNHPSEAEIVAYLRKYFTGHEARHTAPA